MRLSEGQSEEWKRRGHQLPSEHTRPLNERIFDSPFFASYSRPGRSIPRIAVSRAFAPGSSSCAFCAKSIARRVSSAPCREIVVRAVGRLSPCLAKHADGYPFYFRIPTANPAKTSIYMYVPRREWWKKKGRDLLQIRLQGGMEAQMSASAHSVAPETNRSPAPAR